MKQAAGKVGIYSLFAGIFTCTSTCAGKVTLKTLIESERNKLETKAGLRF